MNLSPHFTLAELTHSEIAARYGIDNTPDAAVTANLTRLCREILEPLRSALGRPIFVSSGYRCLALNEFVRGSKRSAHLLGLAADIVAPPLTVEQLATVVRSIAPNVPLQQCIIEFSRWVHVSCWPAVGLSTDAQFLVASLEAGAVKYTPWEVVA